MRNTSYNIFTNIWKYIATNLPKIVVIKKQIDLSMNNKEQSPLCDHTCNLHLGNTSSFKIICNKPLMNRTCNYCLIMKIRSVCISRTKVASLFSQIQKNTHTWIKVNSCVLVIDCFFANINFITIFHNFIKKTTTYNKKSFHLQ